MVNSYRADNIESEMRAILFFTYREACSSINYIFLITLFWLSNILFFNICHFRVETSTGLTTAEEWEHALLTFHIANQILLITKSIQYSATN